LLYARGMPSLPRFLAPLALISALAALGSACTAELEESCLGGECVPPGAPPVPPAPTSGAGGGGAACDDTPATGDFPCDVFDLLQTHCHTCHSDPPKNGAPYSLLTYEDTRAPHLMTAEFRFERMAKAIESGFMPIGETLTDADKQTLLDWLSTCGLPAPDGMGCE